MRGTAAASAARRSTGAVMDVDHTRRLGTALPIRFVDVCYLYQLLCVLMARGKGGVLNFLDK